MIKLCFITVMKRAMVIWETFQHHAFPLSCEVLYICLLENSVARSNSTPSKASFTFQWFFFCLSWRKQTGFGILLEGQLFCFWQPPNCYSAWLVVRISLPLIVALVSEDQVLLLFLNGAGHLDTALLTFSFLNYLTMTSRAITGFASYPSAGTPLRSLWRLPKNVLRGWAGEEEES